MEVHRFASVAQVAGDRHLRLGSVAVTPTVQHVTDERLELEGQVRMREHSTPTTIYTANLNNLTDLLTT